MPDVKCLAAADFRICCESFEMYRTDFSLLEKCGITGCKGCPCDQSAIGLSAAALMEGCLICGMVGFG